MKKIAVTIKLPKPLHDYVSKKVSELKKEGLNNAEANITSVIEGLIAYCKEIEDDSQQTL